MALSILLFVGGLLFFIFLGLPISFSLLACSILMMLPLDMFDAQLLAQRLVGGGNNYVLLAIPFFILSGELMNASGLSQKIVDLPLKLFGHRKGGLGYVAILATVIMASLSGSAVADTAAIGAILLPMMRRVGYPVKTSAGLVAAGGIIGPIIPPSTPFILFGVTANVSIARLFMGGIVPGMIMGLGLAIVWFFHSRRLDLPLQPKASFSEIISTLLSSFWALVFPVIIIGGFRLGFFTATEAGTVAAVYSMFIGFVVYRQMTLKAFYTALVNTVNTVGVVLFLVAAANVSGYLIAMAELPDAVIELFSPIVGEPTLLLALIMVFLFFVGMVMDLVPATLIFVPVFMPLVQVAGINEAYFGILFILNLCIALITPPVGNVLNVITGVAKISFADAATGVLPYLCVHIAVLILLVVWPDLTIVPMNFFMGR